MFMSGKDYRESLGAYKPSVYVNGRKVKSVAGDADLTPRMNAISLTCDYALKAELAPLARRRRGFRRR
jgi:4-hydroxybutyryl-CoA dehydratase/vinylacetyl-CoA-Delta-isomerase